MDRLSRQLEFIKEIDKLKSVDRMSSLINGTRRENTAEHSWHFAMMVMVLSEHMDEQIDIFKTMKMALVHDLVEIDAGDTYCYDTAGHADKAAREVEAAKRIFSILPDDQGKEVWALWEEFETGATTESKFARALDRLNPFMLNFYNDGKPWIKNGIKKSQALQRMGEIKGNVPKLWPYVSGLIDKAVANGWIIDDGALS